MTGGSPGSSAVVALPGGAFLLLDDEGAERRVRLCLDRDGSRDARVGDGAYSGILTVLRDARPGDGWSVLRLGDVPDGGGERAIEVDQSNRSVVVGERAVVKVFPRTAPGPQPALDLPAHLAEVGFRAMPRPLGAVTWTEPSGDPIVVATASEFLPGARDGWDWYLDLLLGWLAGDLDEASAFAPASSIGELAGDLHAALATPSSVLPSPVSFVDEDEIETWRMRAEVALDEALALTEGDQGERLRAREGRVRASFEVFATVRSAAAMRVHGDLHVGQILRWDGGDVVTDFDGNPLAPPELRMARDSPVRDVASLVRSIDHLGRIAQRREAGPASDIERWIERSREETVEGYLRALDRAGQLSLYDPNLLFPFEVAQVCHEYAYAARYLPSWGSVADLAMGAIFP